MKLLGYRAIALLLLAPLLFLPGESLAKSGGGSKGSGSKSTYVHGYTKKDGTYVAPHYRSSPDSKGGGDRSQSGYSGGGSHGYGAANRDSEGRIKRDSGARTEFQKHNPCPSTGKTYGSCPGYVVDHVTPLKRGGADSPGNMQWQTKESARAKDRLE